MFVLHGPWWFRFSCSMQLNCSKHRRYIKRLSKPCQQTWSAIITAHAKLGQGEPELQTFRTSRFYSMYVHNLLEILGILWSPDYRPGQPRLPSMPLLEMLPKMQQKTISIHTATQSAQESHQSNAKSVQTSIASGSLAHVVHPARGQLAVASVSSRHHQLPHAQKGPLPQPFQGQLRTLLAKIGSVTCSTFSQAILSEEVATSASDHSQVKCPAEANGLCTMAQINYQQSQTSHALLTSMKGVPSWLPSLTQVLSN